MWAHTDRRAAISARRREQRAVALVQGWQQTVASAASRLERGKHLAKRALRRRPLLVVGVEHKQEGQVALRAGGCRGGWAVERPAQAGTRGGARKSCPAPLAPRIRPCKCGTLVAKAASWCGAVLEYGV